MKAFRAHEHQGSLQPSDQKYLYKMKNTFSTSNLKKDSLQSLNFHESYHYDDHNRKSVSYIQAIQQNYKLNNYSSIMSNDLTSKNKKKNSKTGGISRINKLNNNDFYSCNSFKSCSDLYIQNYDNLSLNHRINTLLTQLNVNTFQSTFNEILSLGVNNEEFLVTYTKSVFKHAIINPSLSFLYSILSANISSIMKRTKFGDIIEELFEKKCLESFYVPNDAIDKWRLAQLYGIAIFIGNLANVNMISRSKFNELAQNLLQNGSNKSLELLISFVSAGGTSLIQDNKFFDKFTSKVMESHDLNLVETYNSFIQTIDNTISDEEQLSNRMKKLQLTNQSQGSLFTRSDSVPLKLSSMANKMTMDQIVAQYIENPSVSEFAKLLDDNNFSKNSIRTATELLRSIVKQQNESLSDLLSLFCDMNMYQYFNESQIKIALANIVNENKNDEKAGKSLILVYCHLLTEDMATFNDFEIIFESMKKSWNTIIPYFFCEIDNQIGSWVEDMLDVDFWKNLKFIDSNSAIQQMEILEKWKIIDIFPEYDVLFNYYKHVKNNNCKSAKMFLDDADMSIDQQKFSEILFEILVSLNDSQMKAEGIKLKKYFSSFPSETLKFAQNFGDKGLKLASLVK